MPDCSDLFYDRNISTFGLRAYFNFNETPGWRSESLLSASPAYMSVKPWDYADTGAFRNALVFDGQKTIRHVRMDDAPRSAAPDVKSVSLRFRTDDVSQDRTQILLETGDGRNGLNIYIQGDQLVVGAWSKGVWSSFLTRQMPADGAWHQVAFSYESGPSGGGFKAYFDGELFGESDVGAFGEFASHITLGGTSGGTKIDGGQLTGSNRFAGQIDELAVFDRVLSDGEIAVMAAETPVQITGTPEDDDLIGTDANEIIDALSGNDRVRAEGGDDVVDGGEGNDRLEGGDGRDELSGGAGNDHLLGGNDSDLLLGGDGSDRLIGGSGKDQLEGGGDNDELTGGAGHDQLDGGAGDADTAIYSGEMALYELGMDGDTTFIFALGTDEGTDTLLNMERVEFADGAINFNPESGVWEKEDTSPGPGEDPDPEPEPIEGASPSVGINLAAINDYNGQGAFLDLMRTARDWGSIDDSYQRNNGDQTGILSFDENGWVTSIDDPDVIAYYTPIMTDLDGNGASFQAGRYVVRYEGEGELGIDASFGDSPGAAVVVENEPGRMVFDYTPGAGTVRLYVADLSDDPVNYVRDIEVVWEPYEPLLDQGEVYTPDFLESLEGFNSIRFMNWMNVNHEAGNWADDGAEFHAPDVGDMLSPDYYTSSRAALEHGTEGIPVELMVELANKTGTDPWFTIPFGATNAYIEAFGAYVRDNLNPDLKAYFEYGNEVWNTSFASTWEAYSLGEELFGEGTWNPGQQYYAVDAARMSHILQTLWGDDPGDQLITVLSKQTTDNAALLDLMMQAPDFVALGEDVPEQFAAIAGMSPHEVGFDTLGITSYFHTDFRDNQDDVMAMVPNGTDEEWATVIDRMINGEDGLMERMAVWAGIAEDADAYGLQLVGYEGNQHIGPTDNNADYQAFLDELFARPEMGDVLSLMLETWRSIGGGQMEVFQDVGISSAGRWGLRVHQLDENTAMLDAVTGFSETNGMWWGDDRGSAVFEDALIVLSEDGDTMMEGGNRDDLFLLRHADVTDISGGDGDDAVLVNGNADAFNFTAALLEGNGYQVAMTGIERLIFNDETIVLTDDMIL
jgi:Ca2+-binding RTX toxin-like protein